MLCVELSGFIDKAGELLTVCVSSDARNMRQTIVGMGHIEQ